MRRILASAGVGVALAIGGAADGAVVEFDFPITVSQEVPAPTVPDTPVEPAGVGHVTLDTDTNELSWEIVYAGLSGDIVSPGAHFHGPAEIGETAGIEVFIVGGDGAAIPQPPSGTLIGSTTVTDEQEQQILDGLWYVNIHTELNGPGEIRGQVIPEPATAALGLIGATLVTLRRRR